MARMGESVYTSAPSEIPVHELLEHVIAGKVERGVRRDAHECGQESSVEREDSFLGNNLRGGISCSFISVIWQREAQSQRIERVRERSGRHARGRSAHQSRADIQVAYHFRCESLVGIIGHELRGGVRENSHDIRQVALPVRQHSFLGVYFPQRLENVLVRCRRRGRGHGCIRARHSRRCCHNVLHLE